MTYCDAHNGICALTMTFCWGGTLQVVTAGREVSHEEVRMKICFRLTLLTCVKSFRESNVSQFILKLKHCLIWKKVFGCNIIPHAQGKAIISKLDSGHIPFLPRRWVQELGYQKSLRSMEELGLVSVIQIV